MATIRIAVLGAGKIGGTLGSKWVATGHQVAFGVTDPASSRAQALRAELGQDATIGEVADALAASEVVALAVPGGAVDALLAAYASQLDGKMIIDAANRMGGGPMNSVAAISAAAPNARVYRAFNSLGWENFADPVVNGVQADLFYAGPDDAANGAAGDARATVEQLIRDVGLRPVYVGGPEQVALVDAVASLWFALALGQGKGRHLAFKALMP
ncbi:MAG TPA: NAD(P)-binding domain-containing protein [Ktedonobacterales bacterium]|nr:NAD(P)-binding domain-containing protein [Ktedonobacterales bacterium]